MSIAYRQLNAEDASAYKALRLKAVQDHPQAFVDTPQEVEEKPIEEIEKYLQKSPMFGSWDEGALIGMAGYFIHPQQRYSHRGYVHGVYLHPDYRGQKDANGRSIARALMETLIENARQHVEHLELSAATTTEAVEKFYQSLGFETHGRYPKVMKMDDGSYVDDIYMWMDLTAPK